MEVNSEFVHEVHTNVAEVKESTIDKRKKSVTPTNQQSKFEKKKLEKKKKMVKR